MAFWIVRAGSSGEFETFALENGFAVISFDQFPDLSKFQSRDEIIEYVTRHLKEEGAARIRNRASQVWAFSHKIQKGDLIVMPLKGRNLVNFGICSGEYKYYPDNRPGTQHTLKVDWQWPDIPKDKIGQDILYSFGIATVSQIQRNNAEERMRKMLSEKTVDRDPQEPISTPSLKPGESIPESEEYTVSESGIEEHATTQIRNYIRQKFAGHKLSELVAEILKAQDFTTFVSPPGPDGGVDILAGRGMMGFDSPRMIVQVKNTADPSDIKVIRELRGVMQDFNAEYGLFVSWSGFRKSVRSETARNFFQIKFWDADEILRQVFEHYDSFSEEIKVELPLKKVYTLVLESDS